eukprot:scaffold28974_cov16-Tisochrysis_lutea.AAC.1
MSGKGSVQGDGEGDTMAAGGGGRVVVAAAGRGSAERGKSAGWSADGKAGRPRGTDADTGDVGRRMLALLQYTAVEVGYEGGAAPAPGASVCLAPWLLPLLP